MHDSYDEMAKHRMAARTDRSGECWLWMGATGTNGYGKVGYRGKALDTHRVAWMLVNGPIPEGMVIAHRCDVRNCVRPDHLFLATQAENLADMRAKRRHASGPELGRAISAGWTVEKRARKAEQARAHQADVQRAAAIAAGVPVEWKRCPDCDTWKPRSEYQRNAARPDGIKPICRPCATAQTMRLRAARKARR